MHRGSGKGCGNVRNVLTKTGGERIGYVLGRWKEPQVSTLPCFNFVQQMGEFSAALVFWWKFDFFIDGSHHSSIGLRAWGQVETRVRAGLSVTD